MSTRRDFRELLAADAALMLGVAEAHDVAAALQRYWAKREGAEASLLGELTHIARLSAEAVAHVRAEVERLLGEAGGDAKAALTRHGGLDRSIHLALGKDGGNLTRALSVMGVPIRAPLRALPPDRYVDFQAAGLGGMGVVYAALDTEMNRRVAFKMVRPHAERGKEEETPSSPLEVTKPKKDTPESEVFEQLKARLVQEAWVTGGLEHPGIVPVYEIGQTPTGIPYYTMRYVRGERTLADAIREKQSASIEERLALLEPFLKVCDALRYAHDKGIVHRDLKPANVALGEYGEVVLLDWGLARLEGKEDVASSAWQERVEEMRHDAGFNTMAGSAIGTAGYMSPEAALGRVAEVDRRSDVYSLGSMLFEILTGRLPYQFRSYAEYLSLLLRVDPPAAREVEPAVPEALSALCEQVLSREKTGRPASAAELAGTIRGWQVQDATDREVELLLRDVRSALQATQGLTGAALLAQVDLASAALTQALARRPAHPTAADYAERVDAMRKRGMREREEAAAEGALRRVRRRLAVAGVAALILLTVSAFAVLAVLNKRRKAAERAELAERTTRDHAEKLTNYMLGDLGDGLRRIGRLDLLQDVTTRVESYYEGPGLSSPESARNRAAAIGNIGDVFFARGLMGNALGSYSKRLSILEGLNKAHPGSTQLQGSLAAAHEAIGKVLLERGDRAGALKSLKHALELRQQLVEENPDDLVSSAALVDSHLGLAKAFIGPGNLRDDLPLGMHHAMEALGIADAAAGSSGRDAQWQSRLAACHRVLAKGFEFDDPNEADHHAREAITIMTALCDANPANAQLERDLALSQLVPGDLEFDRGNFESAMEAYRAYLAVTQRLVTSDPTNAEWMEDQARAHNRLGRLHEYKHEFAAALEEHTLNLQTSRQLVELDGSNAMRLRILAVALYNVGEVRYRLGEPELGRQLVDEAAETYAKLARTDPSNRYWRDQWSSLLEGAALSLRDSGALKAAVRYARESLDIQTALVAEEPESNALRAGMSSRNRTVASVLWSSGDHDRALQHQRTALSIDQQRLATRPNDTDVLLDLALDHGGLGDLLKRQGDANAALAERRQELEVRMRLAARDPSSDWRQRDAGTAHQAIAALLEEQGQFEDAIDHLMRALAVDTARLERNPGSTRILWDVGMDDKAIGDFRKRRGDVSAALDRYRSCLEVRTLLVARDPANDAWQRDLGLAHDLVAGLLEDEGDLPGALEHRKATLSVDEARLARKPNDTGVLGDLGSDHKALGDLLERKSEMAGALEHYRLCLEIRTRLAADIPLDDARQRALALAHRYVAESLRSMDDVDGALEHYRACLEIRKHLAASGETNDASQRALAMAHQHVAEVLEVQGNLDQALEHRRATLAVDEERLAREPDDTGVSRDLGFDHRALGELLKRRDEADAARHHFRRSLQVREALAARDPANTTWQEDLYWAHDALGDYYVAYKEITSAYTSYVAAAKVAKVSIDTAPDSVDWQRRFYSSQWDAGWTARAIGDLDAADAHYTRALAVVEAYLGDHLNATRWLVDQGQLLESLAGVLEARGDFDSALARRRECLEARKARLDREPKDPKAHTGVGWAEVLLGTLLNRLGQHGDADTLFREALAVAKTLESLPPEQNALRLLFRTNAEISQLSRRLGKSVEALAYAKAALAVAQRVDRAKVDPDVVQAMYGAAYDQCAQASAAAARWTDAADAYNSGAEHYRLAAVSDTTYLPWSAWLEQAAEGAKLLAQGKAPTTPLQHLHVGAALGRADRYREALPHLERALTDESLKQNRQLWLYYNAACVAAASFGSEGGREIPLRDKALAWLRADLVAWKQRAAEVAADDTVHDLLRRHALDARCDEEEFFALRPLAEFRSLFDGLVPAR